VVELLHNVAECCRDANEQGRTLLHLALLSGSLPTVRLLLADLPREYGLAPELLNAPDAQGHTPRDYLAVSASHAAATGPAGLVATPAFAAAAMQLVGPLGAAPTLLLPRIPQRRLQRVCEGSGVEASSRSARMAANAGGLLASLSSALMESGTGGEGGAGPSVGTLLRSASTPALGGSSSAAEAEDSPLLPPQRPSLPPVGGTAPAAAHGAAGGVSARAAAAGGGARRMEHAGGVRDGGAGQVAAAASESPLSVSEGSEPWEAVEGASVAAGTAAGWVASAGPGAADRQAVGPNALGGVGARGGAPVSAAELLLVLGRRGAGAPVLLRQQQQEGVQAVRQQPRRAPDMWCVPLARMRQPIYAALLLLLAVVQVREGGDARQAASVCLRASGFQIARGAGGRLSQPWTGTCGRRPTHCRRGQHTTCQGTVQNSRPGRPGLHAGMHR
jgi:hypothetical protein